MDIFTFLFKHKLFNKNGHFYFSFQICITCTYLTNIFGYIYIYIYEYIYIYIYMTKLVWSHILALSALPNHT